MVAWPDVKYWGYCEANIRDIAQQIFGILRGERYHEHNARPTDLRALED
jgi:hypothetical protein